ALPLEIILRITRFAGFTDVNPDPSLTIDLTLGLEISESSETKLFVSPRITRTHLISMARIHLIPLHLERPEHIPSISYCFAFGPITQCRLLTIPTMLSMVIPLLPDTWRTRHYRIPRFTNANEILVPNHFTPDFMQEYLTQENAPAVLMANGMPARVLFWRWWQPKF
ncbi:hypothetical protein BDV93DRAFT_520015, partial [Ceratobasidium sp. AG-I]